MIPRHWIEHRRAEDNELIGYLCPVADVPDQFIPLTVFGYPVGDPADECEAQHVLQSVGLSYLGNPWLLTLDGRSEPITVQIVEASPQRLVVKNVDYGYEGDIGKIFVLDVPEDGRLRR